MPLSEFQLIQHFFQQRGPQRPDVALGVGDDCALLQVPEGMSLAVTLDTLVAGVHFPEQSPAASIGHKALAVGLSDLAAMGAEPAWATLSLSLPRADEAWLAAFAEGLFALAEEYNVALVGGDTVRGPLSVSLQLHGFVPLQEALRRDGARAGDRIYVTGTLGDGGAGLQVVQGQLAEDEAGRWLRRRLERPRPRVAVGRALRGLASSAIDISDGLAADLGHILERSGVGASLELSELPASEALTSAVADAATRERLMLGAGDDYELCFTVPAARADEVAARLAGLDCAVTCIGTIEAGPGLRLLRRGEPCTVDGHGYDHFAAGEGA